MKTTILVLDKSNSGHIAELAVCLTNEIIERTGAELFNVDLPSTKTLCQQFMENGQYHVIAAYGDDKIIGFATLCESHSLYAEGTFGIIQELYVSPNYRSNTIGRQLIEAAVDYADNMNWKRLELCTPPLPAFEKTVEFYQSNGFDITGGHKMKRIIA